MKKVFIDGAEGTTGLKIFERFGQRDDIEILKIDSDKRRKKLRLFLILRKSFYVKRTLRTGRSFTIRKY